MGRTYIRVKSWHVVEKVDAVGWRTVCGRVLSASDGNGVAYVLPLDEKSCETCLRLTTADDIQAVLEATEAGAEPFEEGTPRDGGGGAS
jgi:hypothetical protein